MCLVDLLTKFRVCTPTPPDPQIIMLCNASKGACIPLDTLLSQYKYTLANKTEGEDAISLRTALVQRLSEDIVDYITNN